MQNNKYILIASNGKGVGKSTFSLKLEKQLMCETDHTVIPVNFADHVRDDVFTIISKHSGLSTEYLKQNYNNIKDKKIIYNTDLKAEFVLRTLLNKYSLFLSEFFPGPVWASAYYNTVLSVLETIATPHSYILTDDLRRYEELEYLISQVGRENIFLVYLHKDNPSQPEETSFENQLDPEDFDLQLTFTENWSNSEELLNLCLNKSKEYFKKA